MFPLFALRHYIVNWRLDAVTLTTSIKLSSRKFVYVFESSNQLPQVQDSDSGLVNRGSDFEAWQLKKSSVLSSTRKKTYQSINKILYFRHTTADDVPPSHWEVVDHVSWNFSLIYLLNIQEKGSLLLFKTQNFGRKCIKVGSYLARNNCVRSTICVTNS